ncbi:hypothetical protein [Roseateles puraquae]|nr:hypothetical protein [Roseateles puraquae]MDG0856410.1 hypothetical protein [Roseateles puraquae]
MAEMNRVVGLAGTARLLGCGSIVKGGASHAAAIGQLYGATPARLVGLAPHQVRRGGDLHMSLLGCEFSRPWLLTAEPHYVVGERYVINYPALSGWSKTSAFELQTYDTGAIKVSVQPRHVDPLRQP